MAEVRLKTTWAIDFTPEEMRLVMKGLRGILKPEEMPAAKELCDYITQERANKARSTADSMEKNVKKMEEDNVG